MTPTFVIFDIICRSDGIPVAVAVALLGLADLVQVVLADEVADGPVAQAEERRGFLQAAAGEGERLLDVLLGDLVEVVGQVESRGEELLGLEPLLLGRDDLLGQAVDRDRLAVLDGHDALDDVLELADVARPGIALEQADDVGREPLRLLAHLVAVFLEEVGDEDGDVLDPFAERRHVDGDDVQAVEELLAELPLGDPLLEVQVRRGDDADVHGDLVGPADPPDLPLLEGAKELDLGPGRHLADLVEEQGAALGQLEHAFLVRDGPGERAADVAEELALEEVLGQRGAVDGDERIVAAGPLEVDGPGGHLLAGPAFPGDEHGRVRRAHLLDEDVDLLHRPALADHLLEAVAVLEVPLEQDVLLLEAPGGQPPADDDLQLLDVEGLDDIVQGPRLEGLDGLGDAAVGRDEDDRQVGQVLPGVAEDVHAVGPGHLDVGDDEVDLFLGQDLEAPGGRLSGLDRVAFLLEDDREQVEEALFVVDDQDRFHRSDLRPPRPCAGAV